MACVTFEPVRRISVEGVVVSRSQVLFMWSDLLVDTYEMRVLHG